MYQENKTKQTAPESGRGNSAVRAFTARWRSGLALAFRPQKFVALRPNQLGLLCHDLQPILSKYEDALLWDRELLRWGLRLGGRVVSGIIIRGTAGLLVVSD